MKAKAVAIWISANIRSLGSSTEKGKIMTKTLTTLGKKSRKEKRRKPSRTRRTNRMHTTENEYLNTVIEWTENEIKRLSKMLETGYCEETGDILDKEDREYTNEQIAFYERQLAKWRAEREQIKEMRKCRVYHHQD